MDETGLFWKLTLDCILATQARSGGKKSKDQVTLVFIVSALGKKDYPSAARQYKALLEIAPNNVMLLNNVAWASGQMKDPKALEYAEKASKLAPNDPAVLDTLGKLLVEKGENARAVEALQKATQIAPNVPTIRLNLARVLIKSGQKDAAKKELNALVKLGNKFPDQDEVAKLMQTL